jgi:hypothetical protein
MYDATSSPAHTHQVRQYGLGTSLAPDGLKVRGWVGGAATWDGLADGAEVCFGDSNGGNSFTGLASYSLAAGAFNGTSGWLGGGPTAAYVDFGTTRVKAKFIQYTTGVNAGLWRFLIKIRAPHGAYGSPTPPADLPFARVYFDAGGAQGCADSTMTALDCATNGMVTNCVK